MSMITAADAGDLLGDFGRPAVLRRLGDSPPLDVTVQATLPVTIRTDAAMPGGVSQQFRRVVIGSTEIAAAGWPGPPVRGDQLLIGSKTTTIQQVTSKVVGTEVVKYDLEVLGL